jgi:hypothetical protein
VEEGAKVAAEDATAEKPVETEAAPTKDMEEVPGIPLIPQQIAEIIEQSPLNPEITSQMVKVVEKQAEDVEGRLSEDELKNLAEVLKTVTKDSAVEDIRGFLADLKEDREDFKEVIGNNSRILKSSSSLLSLSLKRRHLD